MSIAHKIHPVSIVGIGNELLGDDGLGVHIIRQLATILPKHIPCIEVGTAVLSAQDLFEQSQTVIVLDAIQIGAQPGTIYCMDALDACLNRADTLHNLSIPSLLRLIPENRKPHTMIIGIEPDVLEYTMELSTLVTASIPKAKAIITQLISQLEQSPIPINGLRCNSSREIL